MMERERLIEFLEQYFTIGDSMEYTCMRDKAAFAIGTMGLDDFIEFDEDKVADIVDFLIGNGVTIPVRCSDCLFSRKVDDREPKYRCVNICRDGCSQWVGSDDFCSYGERKDGE